MELLEKIRELYPDAIVWDGLDDAIIGYSINGEVVYDVEKIIQILMKQDPEINEEEANEHFDFNIAGSYVGEFTPIHIYTK
jgi:hypothetical protein